MFEPAWSWAAQALTRFYGTDWAAMVLMFISAWRLGGHQRDGWIFGAAACASWLIFNALIGSVPGVVANAAFIVLNIRGLRRWKPHVPQVG